ncbi:MAG TPA: hypothetical protein VK982_13155, partial [Bacteroidales bacterium]|nr:hypothetical protein [Bacteroidales bacterium]
PFYHRSTKTVFELVKNETKTNNFKFGVISAVDNASLSYVVLAPAKAVMYVDELTDANLSYSIPLLKSQVEEFVTLLQASVDDWDNKYKSRDGVNFEFLVSPENKIVQESANVFAWYSTLKYYFQNNEDGPLGTLLFGEGNLKYVYTFDKKSEIKDFIILLNKAINQN